MVAKGHLHGHQVFYVNDEWRYSDGTIVEYYLRGHRVFYINDEWHYSDSTIYDENDPCAFCGRPPTPEGYDACLGYIPNAIGACCGHGISEPYVYLTPDAE